MELRLLVTAGRLLAVVCLAGAVAAGCGDPPLGPPVPSGATAIGGPPVTSAPPPPAGWELKEAVPQSQQQAQSVLIGYLKRTLAALPPGTVFDSTGYASAGQTPWCEDEPKDPKKAPVHLQTIGDVKVPGGMDPAALIANVGEAWRSWGWYVFERDGFTKPNQFGYGPDGYRLQIEMSNPPSYPPALTAISPCFPGELVRQDLTFPTTVEP